MLWTYVLLSVALLFLFLYYCNFKLPVNIKYWEKRGVPSAKRYSTILERLVQRVPVHVCDGRIYDEFKWAEKPYVGYVFLGAPSLVLLKPDIIRQIFVKDADHFVNRRNIQAHGDPYFNKTLLMMEGDEWKGLRATLREVLNCDQGILEFGSTSDDFYQKHPTFTTSKIRGMFSIFNESSDCLVEFLRTRESSPEVEMNDPMGRYTIDVISLAAFGFKSKNFENGHSVFATMAHKFQEGFRGKGVYKVLFIAFLPWAAQFFKITIFDQIATRFMVELIEKNIKYREEVGEKRNDFLQLLIDTKAGNLKQDDSALENLDKEDTLLAGSQKKVQLTQDLLYAQCIVFFIAGFETTQSLLVYTAYELALNPDIQQKLYEGISKAIKENNGILTYDIVVNQLEYLDWVVSETLRKYPAIGRLDRRCTKDYKWPTGEFTIEKGTVVVAPSYALHYDEDIFPEPHKFRPQRFSTQEKSKRPPFTYMPFGLGPRGCIGMRFALTEGKTAIAKLIHAFILEPSKNTPIPMKYAKTPTGLIPDKVYLKLKSR